MWTFEHTMTTTASPAELWARYAEPAMWPQWDQDLASVRMDAAMAVGARGTLKPKKGPATPFTFTDVTPNVGFTDVSRLPLAQLTFTHLIEPVPSGSRFTHGVTITGPLSRFFGRLIGRKLAAGVPEAMRTLAHLAENGS